MYLIQDIEESKHEDDEEREFTAQQTAYLQAHDEESHKEAHDVDADSEAHSISTRVRLAKADAAERKKRELA